MITALLPSRGRSPAQLRRRRVVGRGPTARRWRAGAPSDDPQGLGIGVELVELVGLDPEKRADSPEDVGDLPGGAGARSRAYHPVPH